MSSFNKNIKAFLTLFSVITYGLNAQTLDKIERLRDSTKIECIKVTEAYFDKVDFNDKKDLKERGKNYCTCLYNSITTTDLNRVLKKEARISELLNLEYKKQQERCYEEYFTGIQTIETNDISTQFKSNESIIAYWSVRLISYYIMTHSEYTDKRMIRVSECFDSFLKANYFGQLSDWSKKDLNVTEILKDNPKLIEKLKNCANEIK